MRGRMSEEVGARIGELAREFGLNPRTLRYYESVGLLHPGRTPSGYRVYVETDRERLRFVLRAKRAGLSLGEVVEVFRLRDRGELPCGHVRGWLDRKLAEVEDQLRALRGWRQELRHLRRRADGTTLRAPCICPILEEAEGSGSSSAGVPSPRRPHRRRP
ncbi:MAG: heavy metal-responsive transcriptional regulator [Armatimonadota bacterium]|nr:heavy metal-responsive transcriptional regulator [Armatimonadota bacterium]MDR7529096.1 heavy metal-responsive transcriptional regulator [Armatimonadota bacterium]MDR7586692.1 heavy metal-responsive transcriptional regulator [Armatimonadota bacterium]